MVDEDTDHKPIISHHKFIISQRYITKWKWVCFMHNVYHYYSTDPQVDEWVTCLPSSMLLTWVQSWVGGKYSVSLYWQSHVIGSPVAQKRTLDMLIKCHL